MAAEEFDLSEFESEEDLAGFSHPDSGQYMLYIGGIDNTREKADALKVDFEVLSGTTEKQEGKKFTETFWWPSKDHKDGGEFARKKLARLGLAAKIIPKEALGQRPRVNWDDLVGRSIIGKVSTYKDRPSKKDKTKLYSGAEINGLEIYAVDDPDMNHVPKDPDFMPGGGGRPKQAGGNGAAKPGQQQQRQQPVGAGAGASGGDDLADL